MSQTIQQKIDTAIYQINQFHNYVLQFNYHQDINLNLVNGINIYEENKKLLIKEGRINSIPDVVIQNIESRIPPLIFNYERENYHYESNNTISNMRKFFKYLYQDTCDYVIMGTTAMRYHAKYYGGMKDEDMDNSDYLKQSDVDTCVTYKKNFSKILYENVNNPNINKYYTYSVSNFIRNIVHLYEIFFIIKETETLTSVTRNGMENIFKNKQKYKLEENERINVYVTFSEEEDIEHCKNFLCHTKYGRNYGFNLTPQKIIMKDETFKYVLNNIPNVLVTLKKINNKINGVKSVISVSVMDTKDNTFTPIKYFPQIDFVVKNNILNDFYQRENGKIENYGGEFVELEDSEFCFIEEGLKKKADNAHKYIYYRPMYLIFVLMDIIRKYQNVHTLKNIREMVEKRIEFVKYEKDLKRYIFLLSNVLFKNITLKPLKKITKNSQNTYSLTRNRNDEIINILPVRTENKKNIGNSMLSFGNINLTNPSSMENTFKTHIYSFANYVRNLIKKLESHQRINIKKTITNTKELAKVNREQRARIATQNESLSTENQNELFRSILDTFEFLKITTTVPSIITNSSNQKSGENIVSEQSNYPWHGTNVTTNLKIEAVNGIKNVVQENNQLTNEFKNVTKTLAIQNNTSNVVNTKININQKIRNVISKLLNSKLLNNNSNKINLSNIKNNENKKNVDKIIKLINEYKELFYSENPNSKKVSSLKSSLEKLVNNKKSLRNNINPLLNSLERLLTENIKSGGGNNNNVIEIKNVNRKESSFTNKLDKIAEFALVVYQYDKQYDKNVLENIGKYIITIIICLVIENSSAFKS